ncbi:hypothetical protein YASMINEVIRUS_679 [Yasminevirus sp. GU-2018]|uniref:Uncharacterized protein n=1 Tax=Yasminevirus sp. GU-2018 TaxID=2420051 RepID=A0A5K0UAU0_9VIRU|nr:hypothetical protein YASMINEVIRUS_679 [Yasminevirus sp. GU-2018]
MCGKDIECNSCGKKPNHIDRRRECGKGCECRRCKKENKCEDKCDDGFENHAILIDCNKPKVCNEPPKVECHKKKCEKRCRHKHECSCEEKRHECFNHCDEDCDMKIKIAKKYERGKAEAISLVADDDAIIIPSIEKDMTKLASGKTLFGILYNFECNKPVRELVLEPSCINYGRVTDATDVDECGNFWFLAVECASLREGQVDLFLTNPGDNVQIVAPVVRSCVALIKANYNACTGSVRLLSKFIVPTACACANIRTCPNFEGLVQIGCNDFLLFSDGGFVGVDGTMANGHGVLFVSIKNNVANSYPVTITVNDSKLCGDGYDSLRISTAFNVENGIVFVPQHPEKHCDFVFKITNREIRRIKREIDYAKKCAHLCIEACVKTICIKMQNPCRHDTMIVPVDPFDKYAIYAGIESMTSNNCGELFGTTHWVYPVLVVEQVGGDKVTVEDVSPDMMPYIKRVEVLPEDYKPDMAGFYIRPFTGKINCK